MGTPTNNVLATIDNATAKIAAVLPVIRSTAESITTAINGHPDRASVQQPSSVQELVPRNVGGLDPALGKGLINTMLIVGGIAFVVVFLLPRMKR